MTRARGSFTSCTAGPRHGRVGRLLSRPLPATRRRRRPPARAPAVAGTAGVTASRVAVDLVVRDKKGRLVRDLKPGDLEVLEDGAPQEVLSLRLVDTLGGARAMPRRRGCPARAVAAAGRAGNRGAAALPRVPVRSPLASGTPHGARRRGRVAAAHGPRAATSASSASTRGCECSVVRRGPAAAMAAVDLVLGSSPTAFHSANDRERLRGLRRAAAAHDDRPTRAGGSPAAGQDRCRRVGGPRGRAQHRLAPRRARDDVGPPRLGVRAARLETGMLEASRRSSATSRA